MKTATYLARPRRTRRPPPPSFLGAFVLLLLGPLFACDREDKPKHIQDAKPTPGTPGQLAQAAPQETGEHGEDVPSPDKQEPQFRTPDGTFLSNTIIWDAFPIDLSYLNDGERPAGRHGRVQIRGDQLVFEDGRPARFWGTNIWGPALFSSDSVAVDRQVARLSAFGFNLVRLHHHDAFWADPNVFERDGTTQKLSETALLRRDYWVCKLKAAGIYIWLDLHVERHFEEGDRVPGFEELKRRDNHAKGFNHVNPRIEAMLQDFAARYLRRTNHCTGMSYIDEPAVVAVLLSNEDDLVSHYGSDLTGNTNPYHQQLYRKLADTFAERHGLDREDTYEPWNPRGGRLALIDLEYGLLKRGREHLRSLGYKGPVIGTSYWGNGLFANMMSLSAGDIVDVHGYGEEGFLHRHPARRPHFLSWIGGAHLQGQPMSVSEWNVPWPARDRALAPMWVSAIASLQGWDAPMWYAYQGAPLQPPTEPQPWNGAHDPASMALMPNAALSYRRGDVQPAKRHFVVELKPEALLSDKGTPGASRALTTLLERSRVTVSLPELPQLPWYQRPKPPATAKVVGDSNQAFLPTDAREIRSDTGEIVRYIDQGVVQIDTPKTQALLGRIGGPQPRSLSTLEVQTRTPMAAIALSSLDNKPLRLAERMLLSVAAQAADGRSTGETGASAFVAEPVAAQVRLQSLVHGLELVPLTPDGRELTPIAGKRRALRLQFTLPTDLATHWYLIRKRPEKAPEAPEEPAQKAK